MQAVVHVETAVADVEAQVRIDEHQADDDRDGEHRPRRSCRLSLHTRSLTGTARPPHPPLDDHARTRIGVRPEPEDDLARAATPVHEIAGLPGRAPADRPGSPAPRHRGPGRPTGRGRGTRQSSFSPAGGLRASLLS
ncbi:hypothetical protein Pta02_17840 [Planobispora takensis]|uniref:Uncharacterized protein n=1 Tax=Planobispora takensis TaxID=1367882 RepID=A0A8J3SVY7_9ACTN|nr:hypothetical protein Pta02_17840 [Planobispora takensis]